MTKLEQLQALRAQQQRRGVIPRRVDPRDAEIAQLKTRVAELEAKLKAVPRTAGPGTETVVSVPGRCPVCEARKQAQRLKKRKWRAKQR